MLPEISIIISLEKKQISLMVSEIRIHIKIHINLIYPCHLNNALKELLVLQAGHINLGVV